MTTIQSTAKQAKAHLRRKGIKPMWYFKTPAIQYGLAVIDGTPWAFTISAAKRELRGYEGLPKFFSPTPQLSKGLQNAKKALKIA